MNDEIGSRAPHGGHHGGHKGGHHWHKPGSHHVLPSVKGAAAVLTVSVVAAVSLGSTVPHAPIAGSPSVSKSTALLNSTASSLALYQAKKQAVTAAATKQATAARAAGTPVLTPPLMVMAATTSKAKNGPTAGTTVSNYKWLLNLDNTGNATSGTDSPTQQPYSQNCHPVQSQPNGAQLLDSNHQPVLNPQFPDGAGNVQSVASAPLYGTSVYHGGHAYTLPDPTTSPCPWPALHYETASPVISAGDQSNWGSVAGLPAFDGTHGLPPGKYLVSVTSDGYELGGAHFTICPTADDPINCPYPATPPGGNAATTLTTTLQQQYANPPVVVVGLNPYPLPLATLKARAFADISPTQGAYAPTDPLLQGFHATLKDYDGVVQVDYYGNPLCTEYQTDPNGLVVLDAKGVPIPKPTPYADGVVPGNCMTGADGVVSIPNLVSNRYSIQLQPPQQQQGRVDAAQTQQQWVENFTLEGNHDHDVWLMANDQGLDTEQVIAGEPQVFVNFSFVPGNLNALPVGTVGAGSAVTYSAAGLTDSDAAWTPGQWVNTTIISGQSKGVVASNTASSITLTGSWSPATPGLGQAYSIATGSAVAGELKGQLYASNNYVPGLNGIPGVGGNSGFSGIKLDRPLALGWVALSDNNRAGDGQLVYSAATDPTGHFDIKNIPDGDYTLTYWDQPQDYALDQNSITISNHAVVDTGVLPLLRWFTRIKGKACVDLNGNGRCDPGEPGVPNFLFQNLNRTNNTYEQGQNLAKTDLSGNYEFSEAYPLGQFTVEQFFNTRYKTTGITYQACNDTQEHTILSPFVDLAFLPVIGQCARIDVATQPYDASSGENGGIVATVLNDSVRLNYPARQNIQLDHMTGIPGVQMDLFDAVTGVPDPLNPVGGAPSHRNPNGTFNDANGFVHNYDGSYNTAQPSPLNGDGAAPAQSYITEHAGPPVNCTPQDANGKPVANTTQDAVAVPGSTPGYTPRCAESSLQGVGIGGGTDNSPVFLSSPANPSAIPCAPGAASTPTAPCIPLHGIQTVDGNYSLDATDSSLCKTSATGPVFTNQPGCYQNHPGDFIVYANIPTDNVLPSSGTTYARPLFTASSEEDVNVYSGDQWVPQGSAVGAMAWPPVVPVQPQVPTGNYLENPGTSAPGFDPQCAGSLHTVHVTNPDFLSFGGSPFEGQARNLCYAKLIHVTPGQSVAPNFHIHTINDVPIPGKYSGYIVDDVSASSDPKSTNLGEVSGIANAPVGIYDWAGQLQYTATSDYDGQFEALMPSTQNSNCLTPASLCAHMYRLVGNDPGQPPTPNPNYNPAYRTIAANFQNWPGQFLAADVAPTKAITNLEAAGAQFSYPPGCGPVLTKPQVYAVNRPYKMTSESRPTLTIQGKGFGAVQGTGRVSLGSFGPIPLNYASWTDTKIQVEIPDGVNPGAYQLTVTNNSNLKSAEGITYHVIGGSYNPTILTVGPPTNANTLPPTPGVGPSTAIVSSPGTGSTYTATTASNPGLNLQGNHAGEIITAFATGPNAVTAVGTVGRIASNTTTTVTLTSAGWSNGTPARDTAFTVWPPQRTFLTIQDALETAAGSESTNMPDPGLPLPGQAPIAQALVIVYPANPSSFSPLGQYFENLIVHSPAKIQGVGPGGFYTDGTPTAQGTRINASYFWATNTLPDSTGNNPANEGGPAGAETGGNEPYAADWLQLAENINNQGEVGGDPAGWDGDRNIIEGQAVYVVAKASGPLAYTSAYKGAIDGFYVTGGDQKDFPGNINEAFGIASSALPEQALTDELPGALQTQGGGIFVNAFANYYQITNNFIQGNSGAFGGAIRVGTPYTNIEQPNPGHVANEEDGRGQVNKDLTIANNQIIGNGGTNLAGAIGLFSGSIGYHVTQNVICGNHALEYGGGISHFGLSSIPSSGQPTYGAPFLGLGSYTASDAAMTLADSYPAATSPSLSLVGETVSTLNAQGRPTTNTVASYTQTQVTLTGPWSNGNPATPTKTAPNPFYIGVGTIDQNRISMNGSNDEGGGVMIAGELPVARNTAGINNICACGQSTLGGAPQATAGVSTGAGASTIDSNMISANIADDDGGGIRYLTAGQAPMKVTNNFITNNDSSHEGGGIAIDDAPNVLVDYNTIARNITTATAPTSDGSPAPAGISTARNSEYLQRQLPAGSPLYSNPTITNSIIWDNRAGSWASGGVTGIGLIGDHTPINVWDIGTADGSGFLAPSHSVLDVPTTPTEGCTGCSPTPPCVANSSQNYLGSDPQFGAAAGNQCDVTPPTIFQPPFPANYPHYCGTSPTYAGDTDPGSCVTEITVLGIRTYFRFKPSAIVSITAPGDAFGNYVSLTFRQSSNPSGIGAFIGTGGQLP